MPRPPNQSGSGRKLFGIILVLGILVGSVVGIMFLVNPTALSPFGTTTTTTSSVSTFAIISYTDGEDVSDFVEISVWIPDSDKTIEDPEDVYTMSYFEEEEKSKDADGVSIDLSTYAYVWIEIDPDAASVFSRSFYLLTNPANRAYTLYAYHQSSDVNFNILNVTTLDEWDKAADGNYSVNIDIPHYTTANSHSGDGGWDIDADEVTEMTTSELEDLYNEQLWRSQAPLYVPADDDEKDYFNDLEKLTDAFALKFTMNTTISVVDANVQQVNFTITTDNVPADVIISGELIYVIFYEVIEGPYEFSFKIQMGANITCSNIHSGRIAVPEDRNNLGAFTAYSAIAA